MHTKNPIPITAGQTWRWKSGDIKILIEDLHVGMVYYRTIGDFELGTELQHMRASTLLNSWQREVEFHPVTHATVPRL